jgi:hypothetical protein
MNSSVFLAVMHPITSKVGGKNTKHGTFVLLKANFSDKSTKSVFFVLLKPKPYSGATSQPEIRLFSWPWYITDQQKSPVGKV